MTDPARCKVTGNPCGTDTWAVGHPCKCEICQAWLSSRESLEPAQPIYPSDALQEAARQLRLLWKKAADERPEDQRRYGLAFAAHHVETMARELDVARGEDETEFSPGMQRCPDCADGGACLPGGCGVPGCKRCGKACPRCNGTCEIPIEAKPMGEEDIAAEAIEHADGEGATSRDLARAVLRALRSRRVIGDEREQDDTAILKAHAEMTYAAEQCLYWCTQEPLSRQRASDAIDRAIESLDRLKQKIDARGGS